MCSRSREAVGRGGYGVPMSSPATGPLRLARAAVLATVTIALAAAAHLAGGGALPAWPVLAALAALVLAPAAALAGRRLGAPAVLGLLTAGQLGLHTAFGLLGRAVCLVPGEAPGPHAGHGLAGASAELTRLGATVPGCVPAAVHAGHVGDLGHLGLGGHAMLALHAVATLATAALVARGEQALWWLAAWWSPVRVRAALPRVAVAVRLAVASARRAVRPAPHRSPHPHRGPPRRATALA